MSPNGAFNETGYAGPGMMWQPRANDVALFVRLEDLGGVESVEAGSEFKTC